MRPTNYLFIAVTLVVAVLANSSCSDDDESFVGSADAALTVGGTVSGLDGTVVLQNNGNDELTLTQNGPFQFSQPLDDGDTYAVTVLAHPGDQTCSIANGSGTMEDDDVIDVIVTCSSETYTVGGVVSGLNGTVVLQNNGGDDLSLSSNGNFTFNVALADGAPYTVTVADHPAGQTCTVSEAGGEINGADVTDVMVTCNTNPVATFTVGGTVSGLVGTVVLQNNAADNETIASSGSFTFDTPLSDGADYSVTVSSQPSTQFCTVKSGSGTINGANITNVAVDCFTRKMVFVTAASQDGDFDAGSGGIVGGDAFCNADGNKPNGSNYKAMMVDGSTRVACTTAFCSGGSSEHTDWVLSANTAYLRSNGSTLIDVTNSRGLFTFPLSNTLLLSEDSTPGTRIWTGLAGDWQTSGLDCANWTGTGGNGTVARVDKKDSEAISSSSDACTATRLLACVEQ